MNILFQWLQRNINIIAIVVSFISLSLSIVGLVHSSANIQKKEKWYRLKKLWSVRYGIFHAIIIFCLTCYVLLNWEKCISMQFFLQFNGDNILFLVWIADILLFFYDVEIKEGKLHRRNIEEAKKKLQDKDVELQIGQRVGEIDRAISEMSAELNGGDEKK
ncbi:MAG: hypothetical protein K2O45_13070 [Oscillospiraceae bacterium]|nr:hypothetical protein [Oscillospiraceae bacterium]